MIRYSIIVFSVLALCSCCAAQARAQGLTPAPLDLGPGGTGPGSAGPAAQPASAEPVDELAAPDESAPASPDAAPATTTTAFARGSGHYFNWIKMLATWLFFLVWVRTTDWVSTDCQDHRLQYVRWNPIVFGTFIGFYFLLWLLPWFWLGFPLLVVSYFVPLTMYIAYRNQQVPESQKVLTRSHLRYCLASMVNRLGGHMEEEKRAAWEKGPPIKFDATGAATERDDRAHLLAARQLEHFNEARGAVAEMLQRRASAMMWDFSQQSVTVRYMIDGVWHNDDPKEREKTDPALEVLKVLCGLNPEERQQRQDGRFLINYGGIDYKAALTSQATQTGERVVIQVETENVQFKTLDDLGMRPKMQEQLIQLLNGKQGFVLFSAMPANGLRSTTKVTLHKTDRFTREFLAAEDEANPYEHVENIPVSFFRLGDNVPEAKQIDKVLVRMFRMEPDVIVMRDLVNGEVVSLLCDRAVDGELVIGTIRAKDCAEALLRVLALKVPPKAFAKAVTAVLNQRLIRKLCETCKEAYEPTPQILQQLGIPAGRIQAFYRPPQEPEKVCPDCGGIGYRGRTAVFELMIVDDAIRRLVATGAKTDDIRLAARKAGMQNFQTEGLLLVAKGITSLQELTRVLKQ
ncbi:MAG: Flp pilus assembly complex ATPase component TadA [Pirellulaceae bacterium]|nr:Flp pilus assembly complex ATPase component TadA [Pirellulaceae bacterium]